jgi:methyl-accepting chemotaxis protein
MAAHGKKIMILNSFNMTMSTDTAQQSSESLNQTVKLKADKLMTYALIGYFAFGLFLSVFYETYALALGVGGLCLLTYFVTKSILPNSALYQYVGSGLLAIFTAQFIYQMHGLFEMHFFVFVSTVLLISYQNWKLQLPNILLVVAHHGTFAYLQYTGLKEIYFTQLDYMDLQTFMFHGALAALIAFLCGYWGFVAAKRTEAEATRLIAMGTQMQNVQNNIQFANEISKGNLNVDYKLLNDADELGKALMAMRQNLLEANAREQQEKFITVGITKVGDIIRKHGDNLRTMADEFVMGLVKYLGVNQAGLFLHETEGNDEYLELMACYAFERKKFLKKRVGVGEGLVGQCFLEREQVYMKKVPNDYVQITSGLGGANPESVLLMPLITNETIIGVLELASFKSFSPAQIELVKTACENIAASIVSSRTTERVKGLLTESQQQAEEMKAQEEEMRQNMEELQATQEEMNRKNAEVEKLLADASQKELDLKVKLDELSQMKQAELQKSEAQLQYIENYKKTLVGIMDHLPHKIFLKDKDGKMVVVNTAVAKAHNMSIEQLIGKSDFDFVDAATAQAWREQELEIIKQGSASYIHNDSIGGVTRTLKTVKTAFYIPHLNQTGLLGVQTDITDNSKTE